MEVEIKDYTEFLRPECQGGLWFLANHMKPLRVLNDDDVCKILKNETN